MLKSTRGPAGDKAKTQVFSIYTSCKNYQQKFIFCVRNGKRSKKFIITLSTALLLFKQAANFINNRRLILVDSLSNDSTVVKSDILLVVFQEISFPV